MSTQIARLPFWEKLNVARHIVLMTDYDGTLAPFNKERMQAFPYPGVNHELNKMMDNKIIHIIIVTGRLANELLELLKLNRTPEIWGSHGWERLLPDGTYKVMSLAENVLKGLAEADYIIAENSLTPYSETKPGCLALHWRGIPETEKKRLKKIIVRELVHISKAFSLDLREFDGGMELRAPARNKGDVVQDVIKESPEDAYFVYMGDDLTDEDAFDAIKGKGAAILVRPDTRITKADYYLKSPDELIEFLRLCAALKEG
jgi:trehalose 6-phosphate phosphatase